MTNIGQEGNKLSITVLLALFAIAACERQAETTATPQAAPPEVSVMTFNVQNLFDTVDDEGKDDKAYLPLAAKQNEAHIAECMAIEVESWRDECLHLDWSEAALHHKLQTLANTIKQVNDGRGPDIIAFQEVENARVLDLLSQKYLAGSNYQSAILIEGQDLRGIDVAFLSRLPLAKAPVLHPLKFPEQPEREKDTRGVLEANFQLPDGSILTGLAVHFPAPFHPTDMRIAAYQHLAALRQALPGDHNVFAAGDFNTTSLEAEQTGILERFARPHWTIAHELGCGDDCKGSYFYARDGSWSFLDMLLYSPSRREKTTWQVRADSVRVAKRTAAQLTAAGTPARYRAADGSGVSDHWPLLMILEPVQKQ